MSFWRKLFGGRDIESALEEAEKLRLQGYYMQITCYVAGDSSCEFINRDRTALRSGIQMAPTLAQAITKAAKAIEDEKRAWA